MNKKLGFKPNFFSEKFMGARHRADFSAYAIKSYIDYGTSRQFSKKITKKFRLPKYINWKLKE